MDSKYYATGPGFAGFVVTFALVVALVLLVRSLSKHLRKVRLDAAQREAAALRVEDGNGGGDVVAGPTGDGQ